MKQETQKIPVTVSEKILSIPFQKCQYFFLWNIVYPEIFNAEEEKNKNIYNKKT